MSLLACIRVRYICCCELLLLSHNLVTSACLDAFHISNERVASKVDLSPKWTDCHTYCLAEDMNGCSFSIDISARTKEPIFTEAHRSV